MGHNHTERVDAHQVQLVGGGRSVEMAGHLKHEIGGSVGAASAEHVGVCKVLNVGGSYATQVGQDQTVRAGAQPCC